MSESYKIRKAMKRARNMLIEYGGACEVCKFDFKPILVIHHKIPVSKGGENKKDNIALLCPTCHALTHKLTGPNVNPTMISQLLSRYTIDQIQELQELTKPYG